MKRFKNILLWTIGGLFLLIIIFLLLIRIPTPNVPENITPSSYSRKQIGPNHYQVNNCWLKKNQFGIWEMYLEGEAFERGVIYGVLAKELIEEQERYFVNQIDELVPNKFYQQFLKYFVAWFNRNIYKHIPEENLQEIYGISLSFSDQYDYIGPKFYRILNYHAAHDIGHALNDFHLVGCTSFSVNKSYSSDSTLLIGRNFDFYMGDDFAKEKLLVFSKPTAGYAYASYSWAGLTGVVSGMNEKGLTVTINASKSDIPFASKDPISILAREILQYASTNEEAIIIAKKRETFVSESLLIGSASDHKSILIEKSPTTLDVFDSDADYLVCSNHYQGKDFINDPVNESNITNSDSKARFDRMNELIAARKPLSYTDAAAILRNKEGIDNTAMGLANPKSINQLIAHHAVIFKPEEKKMWVSTSPYQLGQFVGYDLTKLFKKDTGYIVYSMLIPKDTFEETTTFKNYQYFKETRLKITKFSMLGKPMNLNESDVIKYIESNPESYITYMSLGDYYKRLKDYELAISYYQKSLNKVVGSKKEMDIMHAQIKACTEELNKQ